MRLAVGCSLLLVAACGARTGLDVLDASVQTDGGLDAAHDSHDSGIFFDVAKDAVPDVSLLECDGGYFIEVTDDDAGTTGIIHGGCGTASVPSKACLTAGEDCLATGIDGCDEAGAGSMYLVLGSCTCGPLTVGIVNGGSTVVLDSMGMSNGFANVDVTAVGSAAAMGEYVSTIVLSDGGGKRQLHGAFCVHP